MWGAGILVETATAAGDCTFRRQKEFVEWIRQDAVRGSLIDNFWLKQCMTPPFLGFLLRTPSLGPKTGDAGEIRSVQHPQTPFCMQDCMTCRQFVFGITMSMHGMPALSWKPCTWVTFLHARSVWSPTILHASRTLHGSISATRDGVCSSSLLFESHQPHACICLHYIMQHKQSAACGGTHLQVGSRLLYS